MSDSFLRRIVSTTSCRKHGAAHAKPCWWIRRDRGGLSLGICDARARAAGFIGEISDKSLRRNNYNRQEKQA